MRDAIKYSRIGRKWVDLKFEKESGVDLLVVTPNEFMRDAIGGSLLRAGFFEREKFESVDEAVAFVKGVNMAMEIGGFRLIGYIDPLTKTQHFRLGRNR